MKKRLAALVLGVALAATSLTGCGELDENAVVAEVEGDKITADIGNFYARYEQAQYETYYSSVLGDDMWSGDAQDGKTYEDTVKEAVMDALTVMYVLEDHAEEYGVTVTEEDKASIEEAASNFVENNNMDAAQKVSGSKETVSRILELLTIQEKMYAAMTADVDTTVSEEESNQKSMQYVFFPFNTTDEMGNPVEMTDEDKAALKAQADEYLAGAAAADDLAAYTEEAGLTLTPMTFDKTTTSPAPEVIQAADALEEGAFTEVIETASGYYVAQLVSLYDEDATNSKIEQIINTRKQEQYMNLCTEWKEAADVKVYNKVWKKIDFQDMGVILKNQIQE